MNVIKFLIVRHFIRAHAGLAQSLPILSDVAGFYYSKNHRARGYTLAANTQYVIPRRLNTQSLPPLAVSLPFSIYESRLQCQRMKSSVIRLPRSLKPLQSAEPLHSSVHSCESFTFTKTTKHTFRRRHPLLPEVLQHREAGLRHSTCTDTIILLSR